MNVRKSWAAYLLVSLLGFAVYANTFQVPFYFDDFPCIVDNPVVHDLGNLAHLDRFWELGITEDIRNNIVTRIVTYLTFALNYRLHGLAVGGYHLVNLLIHLANALLVYRLVGLLRATQGYSPSRSFGSTDPLALVVALLFVAHPVQTNAVTYIVQRFASLATFFCLIATVSYLQAFQSPTPSRRRLFYACAMLATLTAMFTKEIAYPLPLLLTLCDLTFLGGAWRQRLWRLAPFWAIMLLLPLTVLTLAAHSEITGNDATNALELVNISRGARWSYFFTQWRVIVIYLKILLVPTGLHLEYDLRPSISVWDSEVLASGLLLAGLFSAGLWLLLRRCLHRSEVAGRLIGFGLCWFFITLLMESSIIPLDDLLFEYRLYLPSVGVLLSVASCVDLGRQRIVRHWPGAAAGLTASVALLVVALAVATYQRNRTWQDDLVFWQDNVDKSPNRARSRVNLADAYLKRGAIGKAVTELETAIQINPNHWVPYEFLGDIRWNHGLYRLAVDNYANALRLGNDSRNLRLKLGRAQRWSGASAEARETFLALLAENPADSEVRAELNALLQ